MPRGRAARKLVGKHEGATLKRTHMPCKRARAFGEHHHAHSVFQRVACLVVCLLYLARAALVYKYLVRHLAGKANERNLAQLVLHHPFEVASQMTEYQKYVERALMVAHKHIRLVVLQVLASHNLYRQKQHLKYGCCPQLRRIVTPEVAVAKHAAHARCERRKYCEHEYYRQRDAYLIYSVDVSHC
mgnify:CR=1 FL=1